MDYLTKVSPAIPCLRKVQRHMEKQFKTVARGAQHGTPDKEADVAKLTQEYVQSALYTHEPGRKIKMHNDKAADFLAEGAISLGRDSTIDEWFRRRSHKRATVEEWPGGSDNAEME